jgi:GTP-binding protein
MAEILSVVMAQRHIRLADVVLFIIDAGEGVAALDANIAGYAHEAGKAVVVVVNKWDLATDPKKRRFETNLRDKLKFLDYAPVRFISALEKKGVQQIFAAIHKVFRASQQRIPTGELNRFIEKVDWERTTYPGAKRPKIRYVTQASVGPPTFVFFTAGTERFHFSFERFLVNQLRAKFDFEGTPVVVQARRKRR